MLFAIFIYLFLVDAVHNRLGSSNGKFISFVDTCRSVAQYREGLPNPTRTGISSTRVFFLCLFSFMVKFASQSLVSVLLGNIPVVFSGPRHVLSFLLGFFLIWQCPGDSAYDTMKHSRALRLLVDMGGGLYKLRKVIFAVEAATDARGSFSFALLVAVLAVDGTTLTRRGLHWVHRHWAAPEEQLQNLGSILVYAGGRGAQQALLTTVLPIGAVTGLLWAAACSEWVSCITDDSFLTLRAALLALFIWRAGAFYELARIHAESLAMAEHLAAMEKLKAM